MQAFLARYSGVAALAAAALFSGTNVLAQDECATAVTVFDGANGPFSNAGATTSLSWTCAFGGTDIWFAYQATCSGTATVDTCGGGFDTILEAFSGGCGGLSSIACDDDTCSLQSSVSFPVSAGSTYHIRVGGFNNQTGSFPLNVSCAVTNDECAGAITVVNGANGPFGNGPASTSAPAWGCGAGARDIWFSYVATCTGNVTVDTCGTTTDTVIEAFSGSCGSLTSLGCNDDGCGLPASRLSFASTASTTYYIRVGGFAGDLTIFPLNVSCAGGGIANEECAGAIPVVNGANGPFSNVGSSTSAPSWPCAAGGRDVWFRYVATCCGNLTVETCGASYDTCVQVFDGAAGCAGLASLGCNDDAGAGTGCAGSLQSSLTVYVITGRTYYIRVGGFNSNTGNFPLSLACNAAAPANDECAGAVSVSTGTNGPFNNLCATTSAPAWPCGAGGNDVWFTYVAACTAPHTFRTCGATYDTTIQVFDACGGANLGCNDDAPSGPCAGTLQSRVSANLLNGLTYKIRVGGFGGARGTFPLEIVTGTGNGTMAMTTASLCQPAGLGFAVTGNPNIGGTVTASITGATGATFIGWGYVPAPLLAPACPCLILSAGTTWLFDMNSTLILPCDPIFIGTPLGVQGAELFPLPSTCPFPIPNNFTDVWTVTIG